MDVDVAMGVTGRELEFLEATDFSFVALIVNGNILYNSAALLCDFRILDMSLEFEVLPIKSPSTLERVMKGSAYAFRVDIPFSKLIMAELVYPLQI